MLKSDRKENLENIMKKKNVILITIDCLRADHLGCLGNNQKLTPYLDEIAKKGVLFKQAFSYGSTTFTSIPVLLTSSPIIPYYHYINLNMKRGTNLNDRFRTYKEVIKKVFELKPTIAGILKLHGYKTAAIHSSPYLSRFYGYDKDYSYFDDSLNEHGFIKRITEKVKILLASSKIQNLAKRIYFFINQNDIPYERAEVINKKAISWIKDGNTENFFLWLHYMDTHVPYKPIKRFRPDISSLRMSNLNRKLLSDLNLSDKELTEIEELYDGSIKYVDYSLKSLLEELNELKILDETIVIITADHGEEFKDHGGFLHQETKLYDELIKVPLIIYNTDYKDIVIDEPVSLIDIFPTIIDLLNLKIEIKLSGTSLIPIIKGEKNPGVMIQGMGVNELDGNFKTIVAFRTKQWKYIIDRMRNKEELYNVINDPKEAINLSTINKNVAEDFKSIILEYTSNQHKAFLREMAKEEIKGKIRKLIRTEKRK